MRRLSLVASLLCIASLLSACQPTGSKALQSGPDAGVTPNAVAGDPIEVTALDDPAAPSVAAAGTKAAGSDTAKPQAAPTEAAPTETPAEAAGEAAAVAAPEPAPKPDLTETPVTSKSEAQLACEKKGNKWFKIGDGNKFGCVKQTKDAGKRCERESQCDGVCLARSGTCSPFKPLYGCNEILQDNGARVTLCLD